MGIGIGLFAQAVYSDYKTTSGDELKSPTSSANTEPRRDIPETFAIESAMNLLAEQLQEANNQIKTKDTQIEKLQQALDQQQQLHAVSQNTVDAQRQQLEEVRRPQPLLARLRAVFIPD